MDVTHSDKIEALAAALVKAQGQTKAAVKDSENPFFKSRYADLGAVWDACRDALQANGLSVTQFPGIQEADGGVPLATVTTILLHSSGQWLQGTAGAPLKSQDPQGVGSAITYLRRYALAAVMGIVQEDDDGNAASTPQKAPKRAQDAPGTTKSGSAPTWKGKPLAGMESQDLVGLRAWFVKTGDPKWQEKIQQIDDELAGRQGE